MGPAAIGGGHMTMRYMTMRYMTMRMRYMRYMRYMRMREQGQVSASRRQCSQV